MTTNEMPPCPLCGCTAAEISLAYLGEMGQALALAATVKRLPKEAEINHSRTTGLWVVAVERRPLGYGVTLEAAILMAGEKVTT